MLHICVLAGLCYRLSPLISGSGIPGCCSVRRSFTIQMAVRIAFKFIGGLLTLGGGLTLGREGPSVQIGASTGQGCSDCCAVPSQSAVTSLAVPAQDWLRHLMPLSLVHWCWRR